MCGGVTDSILLYSERIENINRESIFNNGTYVMISEGVIDYIGIPAGFGSIFCFFFDFDRMLAIFIIFFIIIIINTIFITFTFAF